jgi:hypothetical protein
MLVRLRAQITGTRNGQPWPPSGTVLELPDAEAAGLCRARLADPMASERPVERAVPPADVETRRRTRTPRSTKR